MYGNQSLNTRGIIPDNTNVFDPGELSDPQQRQLRGFLTDINTELETILAETYDVYHSVNPEPNVPYLLINIEHPVGIGLQVNMTPQSNDSDILDLNIEEQTYDDVVDDTVKMLAAATIIQTREAIGDDLVPTAS